jgi:CheY-like chemotaxis protein
MDKLKILVIDDNLDAANSLAKLMSKMGYETKAVYSGSEALLISNFDADFIFMDIDLGDMTGYDLVKKMKQDNRFAKTRLIALTGYSSDEDKKKAAEAGFHDHLTKPVGMADLSQILKSA